MTAIFTAVVFALAACSPAKREPAPPHVIAPPNDDAVDASTDVALADAPADAVVDAFADVGAPVASSTCPTSFASGGGLCTPIGKSCEYPDGTCTCAGQSYCGGPAPTPEILKRLGVPRWTCTPSAKTLGPDGCPLAMPNGGPCKTNGKQCHYQPCCAFTVTCVNGKWLSGAGVCPP